MGEGKEGRPIRSENVGAAIVIEYFAEHIDGSRVLIALSTFECHPVVHDDLLPRLLLLCQYLVV